MNRRQNTLSGIGRATWPGMGFVHHPRATQRTLRAIHHRPRPRPTLCPRCSLWLNSINQNWSLDTDRTKEYIFDSKGRLSIQRAHNPKGSGNGVEWQDTVYLYKDAHDPSWQTHAIYPDSGDTSEEGDDQVKTIYNRMGRVFTKTDQRGVVHTYYYNSVGQTGRHNRGGVMIPDSSLTPFFAGGVPHMIEISTGPLPPERAAIVTEMLCELIRDNPGVTGFLLHGSYWDPSSQFPAADIDINWTGQATEGTAGDGLRQWNHVRNGVHVELAPYFWGDLTKPATLSLPTIVSLVRGEVLWERDRALSVPQATARQLMHDPAWVTEKVEAGIAAVRKFRDDWCKPETVAAPISDDVDFVRWINFYLGGFLSAVDLRPPSAARKGFMGIMEASRALELPELEQAIFYAAGMDDFTDAEINGWCERVEAACQCVAERQPDAALYSLRYCTVGAREIVRRGFGPAALWPLWRAARQCANQLPDEALTRDCFAELGRRLRVLRVEDILAKAARLTPVIELLEQHREGLIQHVLRGRVS